MPPMLRIFRRRKKINHSTYRILSFEIIAPYTLRTKFNDHKTQVIKFYSILKGELYRPLKKLSLFNQVKIETIPHKSYQSKNRH